MNQTQTASATNARGTHSSLTETRVRGAVEEILASRPFKSSPQLSTLLRYIVEHSLSGEENLLRERVIGSEVFGRKADYEPGEDPVVRLRASEIRKRLAQFYQAEGAKSSIRISIPPGSYKASFETKTDVTSVDSENEEDPNTPAQFPAQMIPVPSLMRTDHVAATPASVPSSDRHRTGKSSLLVWSAVLVCLVGSALAIWLVEAKSPRNGSQKQIAFWSPLVAEHQPLLLCIADHTPQDLNEANWPGRISAVIAGTSTTSHRTSDVDIPFIPYVDTLALNKLTYWLGSHHNPFVLQRSSQLTIEDFRRGPAVLIGASDNDWSLVLLSKLRFHIQVDPKTDVQWIEDSQQKGNLQWKGPGDVSYTASSTDYGIITKVLQPDTGKWLIAVGGLGNHGTEAAADLITDEGLASLLPDKLLDSNRNVQIVVRTNVINGHNSVPQIVASHSW